MSQSEVAAIMTAKNKAERTSWEQTRLKCFYTVVAQAGTKKIKKPADLFPLVWDAKEVEKKKAIDKKKLSKSELGNLAQTIKFKK